MDIETGTNDIYKLSDDEIQAVAKWVEQLNNGNYILHEQVKSQTAQWLKK